ncbi:hypothetical protein IAE22_32700, partial [Bacillus sp. S34]|nr:hypothetical protein [Bacillus sp. S34]
MFLLDLHNDLFADVYDGIRAVTEPAGKHVVLSVSSTDGKLDEFALEVVEDDDWRPRGDDRPDRQPPLLAAGGYANAATQDAFCSGTTCTGNRGA